MAEAKLEHVNLTVTDAVVTAKFFVDLFGWKIRWQGDSIHNGYTVHVGGHTSYLALYSRTDAELRVADRYNELPGLNHIAITVDDLPDIEQKIIAAGYKTHSHADYEPGQRFYFDDNDGLEIEVVSYN